MDGAFGEQWQNYLDQQSFTTVRCSSFQSMILFDLFSFQVDISASIGYLLSIKDKEELGLMKKACEITGKLYSKHLKDQIVNTVESERVGETKNNNFH